ncbi:MAG: hypothetical protein N2692_00580 [Patescibacteria group bacterium]|jgi:hypothetical protein|nr:hypothetical protein [Patescibacteria group bacterium]
MAKKLDAIANNQKKPETVLDLRTINKKTVIVPPKNNNTENLQKQSPTTEKTKNKKIQPIWWTVEEKYSYNSWLSIIFFILSLVFIIVAFLQSNWIFFVIILLADVLFVLYFLKPQKSIYRLTEEGLYVAETFYSYNDLNYFWIMETADKNFIIFKTNKFLNTNLFVPFKKEKTDKIKEFLKNLLPEKEIKPSLIDLIANIF